MDLKFIGRANEINDLEKLYKKKGFSMAVLYGRRRIGKSFLLERFIEGKKTIYYVCTKTGGESNTSLFSSLTLQTLKPSTPIPANPDLEYIFQLIGNYDSNSKLVIVFDEFPYWASDEKGLLSLIQKYIDTMWRNREIMLIICGSTLSFMENEVLSEKSPLFGRRDIQIKLEPFDYLDTAQFVPNFTNEEKAMAYGLTGGVAKYISLFDDSISFDENVINLFFNPSGYLFDEPRNFLSQEFSDTSTVNKIIESIAKGNGELNDIASKTHESSSAVTYTLKRLIEVGIVEKKICIFEETNKKKVRYAIKDQMFRFWYTFIPSATSFITIRQGDLYYEAVIKNKLHDFMGEVFEIMCRRFVLMESAKGKLNGFITNVGRWWGKETIKIKGSDSYQSTDIDIVGESALNNSIVVGECKYRNSPIDKEVYEKLIQREELVSKGHDIVNRLLFSLSGFTQWYKSLDDNCLKLYTLDDLYKN